jgi:hypothetical protein
MQQGIRKTNTKLSDTRAYKNNGLLIKMSKMNDIKKHIGTFIDYPYKEFYDNIFTWPTDNTNNMET